MSENTNLKSITSLLAICASLVSACTCVLLISGYYHSAHYTLDTYEKELQGWEACRQTSPDYFESNKKAVDSCMANIDEAKANFWVKTPKAQWTGILIFSGLASASVGYLVTWIVVWLVGYVIYKIVRLITSPFRNLSKSRVRQHQKASCGVPKKHKLQSSVAKA